MLVGRKEEQNNRDTVSRVAVSWNFGVKSTKLACIGTMEMGFSEFIYKINISVNAVMDLWQM